MAAELIHHRDLCLAAIRAAESGPSPNDLAGAPLMESWCALLSPHGSPVLWGKVIDHPRLGTAMMTTSRLVVIDPERGVARSLSRWFRLGAPHLHRAEDPSHSSLRSKAARSLEEFEACGFATIDADSLSRLLSDFISEAKASAAPANLRRGED